MCTGLLDGSFDKPPPQEAPSAVAQFARLRSSEVATLRRRQFEEPRELIRPRGTRVCARHVP